MGWTKQASDFITLAKYEDLPTSVIETVKRATVDTVACMIAGNKEEVTTKVANMIKEFHDDRPISTVIKKGRYSPTHAAFINGVMAHAVDYDDVNAPTLGHPSTVILPAALAVSELAEVNGKEFIMSYVVGVEIMSVLGEVLGLPHYKKGWHSTATYGTLGATAAASRALSLNAAQVTRALSIATSQTAGTRQNFGTMMKPFHAGNAARIGVWSAQLAKNGFTSSDAILESRMGYLNLYAGNESVDSKLVDKAFSSLGKKYRLEEPGIDVKKYPCCYWTARAADGVLDIVNNESFALDEIDRIEVVVPSGGLNALIYERPQTGLEAKFSMEYVVSASLLDKKINFQSFEDDYVTREAIVTLEEKVVKWEDPTQSVSEGANAGFVTVKINLANGTIFSRVIKKPRGSSENPLTLEELQYKMDDCISYSKMTGLDSKEIIDTILSVEKSDNIRSWMNFLV